MKAKSVHTHLRQSLLAQLREGVYKSQPDVETSIQMALQSSNPEWLFRVFNLLNLSGHFKTGQRWSLQNRPTGMARDGVVLPLWDWTRQARFSPPTPRAAFEDVAVMEQPVQHGCDGGAITQ